MSIPPSHRIVALPIRPVQQHQARIGTRPRIDKRRITIRVHARALQIIRILDKRGLHQWTIIAMPMSTRPYTWESDETDEEQGDEDAEGGQPEDRDRVGPDGLNEGEAEDCWADDGGAVCHKSRRKEQVESQMSWRKGMNMGRRDVRDGRNDAQRAK